MFAIRRFRSVVLCVAAFCAFSFNAAGVVVIDGKTATVANGFTGGSHPAGSHFHSATDHSVVPASNPALFLSSVAEVGGFFGDEELQGISEFELLGEAVLAVLLFDVRDMTADISFEPIDGLFGQGPLNGIVDVYPYEADHVEHVSDFVAEQDRPTDPPLLSMLVGTGLIQAGDTISTDVTTIYNDFVVADEHALGIRLQTRDADKDAGAITFNNFRLEITLREPQTVPEPSPVLLLGLVGLLLSGVARYRRVRS